MHQSTHHRFKVKIGAETFFFNHEDICFFEARAKEMVIKTFSAEKSWYASFADVFEQLPEGFMRCHKGFAVNLQHIRNFNSRDMELNIADGSSIPVSRSYKHEVVKALNSMSSRT